MINLENDRLTFSFPEIASEVRSRLEKGIREILPVLLRPEERENLMLELESDWRFQSCSKAEQQQLRAQVESLSEAKIEAALQQAALSRTSLDESGAVQFSIDFQRTLRIPDDGKTYPLPAGFGRFPMRSVDDFPETVRASWTIRGGVMMPMYQSEALWLHFSTSYPFAVKIGSGMINAVSGEGWTPDLQQDPQNYVVVPGQPWLDGFAVGKGLIRQFVAMPLGEGYTVEEQLTGKAETGGIQLQIYPMRADHYFRNQVSQHLATSLRELFVYLVKFPARDAIQYDALRCSFACAEIGGEMGLGAGGKMRQEVFRDPHEFSAWDQGQSRRCFIHLCNSMVWRQITGTNPPHPPLTAKEYKRARIPWFDYYRDDLSSLNGSEKLAGLKSVSQVAKEKSNSSFTGDESIAPDFLIQYGNNRRPVEIREFHDAL